MKSFIISFTYAGDTKRRFKYAEISASGGIPEIADAKIGMIYIKKDVLENDAPKTITGTFTST